MMFIVGQYIAEQTARGDAANGYQRVSLREHGAGHGAQASAQQRVVGLRSRQRGARDCQGGQAAEDGLSCIAA
jgi:hypothetical protein